jgi:hypothetical protein
MISAILKSILAFLSLFRSPVVKPDLVQLDAFSFFNMESLTAGRLMIHLVPIMVEREQKLEAF